MRKLTRRFERRKKRGLPWNRCDLGVGAAEIHPCRQHHASAFAEADAGKAVLGAVAAEGDFIAVLDEAACFAARQRERFAAARGEFKEAAPARFLRSRYGAGADQVAGARLQPLPVWCAIICATVQYISANEVCVMRAGAVPARRIASVATYDFQRDVEAAMRLILGIGEIRQRRRVACGPRVGVGAVRRQRLGGHHPGRYRGGEVLSQERAERLILPRLHIARRPIIEQAEAEDVVGRLADRHRFAEFARRADVEAKLQLEIEIARRSVAWLGVVWAFALAARPLERRAARDDRRRAAVIGDRHIFVVRHQRIVGAEHPPRVGGVEDRGEEIGEIADRHWQLDFGLRHRHSDFAGGPLSHARCSSRVTAPGAAPTRPAGRASSDD